MCSDKNDIVTLDANDSAPCPLALQYSACLVRYRFYTRSRDDVLMDRLRFLPTVFIYGETSRAQEIYIAATNIIVHQVCLVVKDW